MKHNNNVESLTGINGKTAFLAVVNKLNDNTWGYTAGSKEPPLTSLRDLLTEIAPNNDRGKYACLDLGGELSRNPQVQSLLAKQKYKLRPTALDSPNQNALAERPMQTIRNGIRELLQGAVLEWKYWPYSFYHFLRTLSWISRSNQCISPYDAIMVKQPDIADVRTFGCTCIIRLPGKRFSRLDNSTRDDIFLGYTSTMQNIWYVDTSTNRIKTDQHATYDEGMSNTPSKNPTSR